jgi:uncharacterized protein YhbP (UPF0306 family)
LYAHAVSVTVLRLIRGQRYMSLATSDGLRPWVAAVAYVAATGPAFYWASRRDARHSGDILATGRAAATIFNSEATYEAVEGIQFAGSATVVADQDVETIHALYLERFPMYADVPTDSFLDSAPFGFYRLDCTEIYLLAPASPEGDHRIPVDIASLDKG